MLSTGVKEREKEIRSFIEKHARTFGLDPNLIRAIITQESRFNAEATSPTGAYGYGQFTRIGARQVQNIAQMSDVPSAEGLEDFTKANANDPDIGVKGICATIWWLLRKKYKSVADEVVRLEAALTFYNAGGRAAALVVQNGGHKNAIEDIKEMPARWRSQSLRYAPEVASWFVQWHEVLAGQEEEEEVPQETVAKPAGLDPKALVEGLKAMGAADSNIDVIVTSRDGLTEVSIILPGEFE